MAQLPTNRTTANTPTEHVNDHNTVHATHNLVDDFDLNASELTSPDSTDRVLLEDASDGSKKWAQIGNLPSGGIGQAIPVVLMLGGM